MTEYNKTLFTLIIHFGLYDLFILWGKRNYLEGKIVHNGEHRTKELNLKIGRQRHFICSTGAPSVPGEGDLYPYRWEQEL
jgi:hypothetical protein